ncbi:MAG: PAS domain-containing protein [Saccharofermentanales bacterium]
MMIFDIKTLMFLNFIINLISAGTIFSIWYQHSKRYSGIVFWLLHMSFLSAGSLLIMLRGSIPDFISVIVSNLLILAGAALLLIGLGKFIGKKINIIPNIIFLIIFSVSIIYFDIFQPDITMREILLCAMLIFISTQGSLLLLYKVDTGLRQETKGTGITMALFSIVSLARLILLIIFPLKTNDFFEKRYVDPVSIAFYVTLGVGLAISLVLMVNQRLVRELKEHEEKFTITFNSSPYAILLINPSNGTVIEANDGFMGITGYNHDEVIGRTISELSLWNHEQDWNKVVKKLSDGKNIQGVEYRFNKKSGESFVGLYSAKTININNENFILSNINDINEFSKMKQQLEESATHDSLTGLPNRILFNKRFDDTIQNAKQTGDMFAVLSLDIDNFKAINDSYGHDIGDNVLVEIASRMVDVMRKEDIIARFGGDEFLVLLYKIDHKDDALYVADRIKESFYNLIKVMGHELNLTVSIGIAIYPENGFDMNTLIKKSDLSMYYVKEHGKNDFRFYSEIPDSVFGESILAG